MSKDVKNLSYIARYIMYIHCLWICTFNWGEGKYTLWMCPLKSCIIRKSFTFSFSDIPIYTTYCQEVFHLKDLLFLILCFLCLVCKQINIITSLLYTYISVFLFCVFLYTKYTLLIHRRHWCHHFEFPTFGKFLWGVAVLHCTCFLYPSCCFHHT